MSVFYRDTFETGIVIKISNSSWQYR